MAKAKIYVFDITEIADVVRRVMLKTSGEGTQVKTKAGEVVPADFSPTKLEMFLNTNCFKITGTSAEFEEATIPPEVTAALNVVVPEPVA